MLRQFANDILVLTKTIDLKYYQMYPSFLEKIVFEREKKKRKKRKREGDLGS
jgi:hypothetical protein